MVILQHRRERDVAINTARIAALCLPNAELHVGTTFDPAIFEGDPSRPPALLWPGEGAEDVEAAPPSGPITLVVVDGTWSQAKKLVRTNLVLEKIRRFAFRPPNPSDYRIRREPRVDFVSTLEALVFVLGVLEGDRERFLPMLAPFRAMVDAQLDQKSKRTGPRRMLLRRGPRPPGTVGPLLRSLRERKDDLVCVYGEANAWPYASEERTKHADELIHWVAWRPSTGETFDELVAPRAPLAPSAAFHAELDEAAVKAGVDETELARRWEAFLRPNDVVCSWGHYAPWLLMATGARFPEARVDVRQAARIHHKGKVGTIEECRTSLGAARPEPLRGRAGRRLAELVGITNALSS